MPSRPIRRLACASLPLLCLSLACAPGSQAPGVHATAAPRQPEPEPPAPVLSAWLQVEVLEVQARERERLEADLREAQQELVALEGGRGGTHTLADTVSAIAAARVEVARAEQAARWSRGGVEEMRGLLAEAERHLEVGNFHSASFLASRVRRIARSLEERAAKFAEAERGRRVVGERANLRMGPSTRHAVIDVLEPDTPLMAERDSGGWLLVLTADGLVGWIHAPLVR